MSATAPAEPRNQYALNRIARRRADLTAAGYELTDLTDTNPTRHGLFDPAISDILARHAASAGRYDPTPRGPWPARAALAERFGGDPEDYWLTASTSEAYGWLFSAYGSGRAWRGDQPRSTSGTAAVASPSPGYPLVEPLAALHGLTTRAYATYYVHPSGWELDEASLRTALADPSVQIVVAVNPNNPTGGYCAPDVLAACAARRLPLIADEVFWPFRVDDAPGTADPLRLAGNEDTLTYGLDGLSKLLAAPQLKVGWIRLSGPADQREAAAAWLDGLADTYLSVGTLPALALPDLLTLADSTVDRVTTRLRTNLATLRQSLLPYRVRTVQGGWMALLDVPAMMDADDLVIALMDRAGLAVHPGWYYDLDGHALALSLLPDPKPFAEACERLAAALAVLLAETSPPGTAVPRVFASGVPTCSGADLRWRNPAL